MRLRIALGMAVVSLEWDQAFEMAQRRLSAGRMHHAMRAVALAKREFEMICERALSRYTQGGLLAEKLEELPSAGTDGARTTFKKIKPKSLQIFSRQFATMIEAGLSVVAAWLPARRAAKLDVLQFKSRAGPVELARPLCDQLFLARGRVPRGLYMRRRERGVYLRPIGLE